MIKKECACEIGDLMPWECDHRTTAGEAINIIFDGPPGHTPGRFVEVETDDGKSIHIGEWIERNDGCWALRITSLVPKLREVKP